MIARTLQAAALALVASASGAAAETALDKALAAGGTHLDAEAILDRLAGKTVTFVNPAGTKTFLIYYGTGNQVSGRMVGGKWADEGFYAVTDADTVCLSWEKSDKPRLRCMDVVEIDGQMFKFKPDGSAMGNVVKIVDGNAL